MNNVYICYNFPSAESNYWTVKFMCPPPHTSIAAAGKAWEGGGAGGIGVLGGGIESSSLTPAPSPSHNLLLAACAPTCPPCCHLPPHACPPTTYPPRQACIHWHVPAACLLQLPPQHHLLSGSGKILVLLHSTAQGTRLLWPQPRPQPRHTAAVAVVVDPAGSHHYYYWVGLGPEQQCALCPGL